MPRRNPAGLIEKLSVGARRCVPVLAIAALALGPAASGALGASLFSPLAHEMTETRVAAIAAVLPDGNVLIAGGENNNVLNSAELFNLASGEFEALAPHTIESRYVAMAAPLPGGRVLIAGGENNSGGVLNSAELFNPVTEEFEALSHTMTTTRDGAVAAALPDGKVLVAGGESSTDLYSAELFNPASSEFEALSHTMTTTRDGAVAVTLPDGNVLIADGNRGSDSLGAELFNPALGEFEKLAGEQLAETRSLPIAAALPGGKILITGGDAFGGLPRSAEEALPVVQAQLAGGGFGHQVVAEPSAEQTVTVTDVGNLPLAISSATLGGPDTADFTIEQDTCVGVHLLYRQTCAITVGFTPPSAGPFSATLALDDNEITPSNIVLTGTGVAANSGPQGPQGPAGSPGNEGSPGMAGNEGSAGKEGSPGKEGATGKEGSPGKEGATGKEGLAGKEGPAGKVGLLTCLTVTTTVRRDGHKHVVHSRECTAVSVSTTVKLTGTGAAARVTLERDGKVYATGTGVQDNHGRTTELLLADRRPMSAGAYTLVLRRRSNGRWISTQEPVTIG